MKKLIIALLLLCLLGCAIDEANQETYFLTATVKLQTGEIIKINVKNVKYFNSYARIYTDDGVTYYVHPSNFTLVREKYYGTSD